MRSKAISLMIIFLVTLVSSNVHAADLDPILEKLDISGFIRTRSWSLISKTRVPDKFLSRSTYRHVNYIDLFARTRFNLKIIPEVEVKSVFDIYALYGKRDFSLGNADTNLITRDIYVVFRPGKQTEISLGLMPFSLPGGYILASNGTGLQITRHLFRRKLSLYFNYLKAYDNADESFGQNIGNPDYVWDDVFIAGFKFNTGKMLSGELYYVYEDDRYTSGTGTEGDGKKGSLHWVGLHTKILGGRWHLDLGGIYNFGYMYIRDINNNFRTIHVKSGLLEFKTGLTLETMQISLIAEGATGDPNKPEIGISFQDIRASHSFSNIAVDNSGGLALRGIGESSWYGLCGGGLTLEYTILDTLTMKTRYLHFRTTKYLYWRRKATNWFGDEIDLNFEYKYRDIVTIFLTGGGFLPQRAYNAQERMNYNWYDEFSEKYQTLFASYENSFPTQFYYRTFFGDLDNDTSKSMIFEIMMGATVRYD